MIGLPEDEDFYAMMRREVVKARKKFPKQSHWRALAALTEEVGELNQAILQDQPPDRILAEAVQTAVMAMRVVNDSRLVYTSGIEAAEEE